MNSDPSPSRDERLADGLFVAVAVVAALLLRVLPFADRVIGESWILPAGDADVAYHLRRIAGATTTWPWVPDFDAWMDHPRGAYSPWPPLFDFLPATFARATGLDPILVGVLWPPLLGALSVAPFFALARGSFGRRPAWLATLLFTLMPASVAISTIGRTDHHVAEVLLQLWVYAWLVRSLVALERGETIRMRQSFAFGVLLGASLLTWAGSMLYLWVAAAATSVWLLPPRSTIKAARAVRHLVFAHLTAALICAPFALHQALRGGPPFAHYELSLLTVRCVSTSSVLRAQRGTRAGCGWPELARAVCLRGLGVVGCAERALGSRAGRELGQPHTLGLAGRARG